MRHLPIRYGYIVVSLVLGCSSSGTDANNKGGGTGATGPIFNPVGGNTGTGSTPSVNQDGGLEALRRMACAGQTARTEPLPAVMMLVVDTSGSMDNRAPGGGGSKWEVTREALRTALGALPASTGVGVLYYPNQNTEPSTPNGDPTDPPRPLSACVDANAMIPIELLGAPGSPHRTRLTSSLDSVNGPQGGTPTDDAVRTARPPIETTTLPGSRFLVLITDGQPTFLAGCVGTGNVSDAVDPNPIIADITAAKAANVSTFVIGSPGSEAITNVPQYANNTRKWLSLAASAGGTATPGCNDDGPNYCHFDMSQAPDFADALRGALGRIVGTIVSCEYPLPIPPNNQTLDPTKVNVVFTPSGGQSELILQSTGGNCTEGWRYTPDGQHVELCPDTCNRIKGDPDPTLDVWFGCGTQTGPVH
jgi:hypothetical protein